MPDTRGASASGAANGAADSLARSDKFNDERSLMQERMRLEEEKQMRIEERTEARKNAPLQRFSGILGAKRNEEVPQEAEDVTRSTSEGAKSAGYEAGLVGMTREQVAAYKDPDMLAQFDKQMEADNQLAKDKVAGKTRKRTFDESVDAARQQAATDDPAAFVAGESMFAGERKDKRAEDRLDRKDVKDDLDRKFKEKQLTSQEMRDAEKREVERERIEKAIKDAAESGSKAARQQGAMALRRDIDAISRDIRDLERSKKGKLDDEITSINEAIAERKEDRAWLVSQETEYFKDSGVKLPDRERPNKPTGARGSTRVPGLPDGTKQIGTSKGKPVYETPDGKRYVAN